MKTGRSGNCRLLTVALLTALSMLTTAPLVAQSSSDFSTLQKHVNKQVTVETQDGQVAGQLLRAEERRLVVYEAGSPKSIARESVRKVTRHKSRHTAAWGCGDVSCGSGHGIPHRA
jgi:hypothetical protein